MIARLNELEQQKREAAARLKNLPDDQTCIPISGRSTAPGSSAWPPRSMIRRLPIEAAADSGAGG